MTTKPNPPIGLRHLALQSKELTQCVHFYTTLLGMKIVWQPDADNVYLSSGTDNLALHRAPADFAPQEQQHLDHIGFFLAAHKDVDDWYNYLRAQGVSMHAAPKEHRDGSRSFYCKDPDGNIVQLIYMPTTNAE